MADEDVSEVSEAVRKHLYCMSALEWERNPDGTLREYVRELPFRPEFIRYFSGDGSPHPSMPWAQDDPERTYEYGLPRDPASPISGEVRGKEPPPYCGHLWALDARFLTRHGIDIFDVSRVELPTLDYAVGDPLLMRVFVRKRVS